MGLSPSVLKEVRHQMKIDVSIDEGVMLESVTVTAMRLVLQPEPKAPKMIGKHADSVQYLQTASLLRQPLLTTDYTAVCTGLRNETIR